MKTKTVTLALTVLLLAPCAALASFTVTTEMVPTAEGIELATDIYRPAKLPAPVVLVRTPYGRKGFSFLAEALVAEGYAVAMQDVRGKYGSTGDHEPFRHERHDSLATLRWISKQSWCNGRIGMWGSSYSGYAALRVADVDLDAFRSIFSISGWLGVEDVVLPGGANHLMLNLTWMLTQGGGSQRNLNDFDMDRLFRHTPVKDAMKAAGIRNTTWEDAGWIDEIASRDRRLGTVERPVFQLTGWHDMVYRGTLEVWEQLARQGKAPHKLAIGPWYHNQMLFGSLEVGDASFGEVSGFGTDEMIALTLRWFDATLKGKRNGILDEPPVKFFLMGQDAWHAAKSWPPRGKDVKEVRWYLGSAGDARSSSGDGWLATEAPDGAPHDTFVFEPENPVPTFGGANFFYYPELVGVRDQSEIATRDDVLVYTSEPLERELQIVGRVNVRLAVATSGRDTDFTAKLVVVRPDGYARIVEDGIARASAWLEPVPPPGEPFELTIDVGHTAIAVPAGHRLRLEVSSSNFPKYDRNPNTGETSYAAAKLETARQTVFHTAEHPSWVTLPVRARPLVARAANRRPLVHPVTGSEPAVVAVTGGDAAELFETGRRQLGDGEVDQAIATLERVTELAPGVSEHHHWLGRAYLGKLQSASLFKKLGLSKKVRASYLRSIELEPANVEARESLAHFYLNAPGVAGGSTEKAMEQIGEIRKRDARAAHLLMAQVHSEKKRTSEAAAEYRAAIALDPEQPDAHYALGLLLQAEKLWDDAFDAFEAAVRHADHPPSLYQVGRTAVLSGQRLERGKQAFERYISEQPESTILASAHWRLGMLYEHMGRKDLARGEYETALKLEPEHRQAKDALKAL